MCCRFFDISIGTAATKAVSFIHHSAENFSQLYLFFTVRFLAMQNIFQKNLFLFQIIKVFDEKKSWKDLNKCQFGRWHKIIHNFLKFGHSKKCFTNLQMAGQVKITDIKRFDESLCLIQFATLSNVRFQKI